MGPIRAMLSDVGITEQQWRVLRVLDEAGPQEPTRIADRACLLLPSLTRILQKLSEKGLIERTPDRMDRRKQVVSITEKGAAVIEDNLATSIAIMDRIKREMGVDNFEALLDLLNLLDNTDVSDAASSGMDVR